MVFKRKAGYHIDNFKIKNLLVLSTGCWNGIT